jgi:hypothetical protein
MTQPQQAKPQPTAAQTAQGCGCLIAILLGLSLGIGLCTSQNKAPEAPKSKNLDGNEVGQPLVMGKTGCERTLKKMLRDPESLQKDEYTITEASPTAWAANLSFRSRNGFGGMNPAQAICTFDGKQYTVSLTSGQ